MSSTTTVCGAASARFPGGVGSDGRRGGVFGLFDLGWEQKRIRGLLASPSRGSGQVGWRQAASASHKKRNGRAVGVHGKLSGVAVAASGRTDEVEALSVAAWRGEDSAAAGCLPGSPVARERVSSSERRRVFRENAACASSVPRFGSTWQEEREFWAFRCFVCMFQIKLAASSSVLLTRHPTARVAWLAICYNSGASVQTCGSPRPRLYPLPTLTLHVLSDSTRCLPPSDPIHF